MKKKSSYLFLPIVLLISVYIVFASDDAPPSVPTQYWGIVTINGAPAADGLTIEAFVAGIYYSQPSQTFNSYYDIILINGDRELTYNDDRDCSTHWANNEACVPCDNESDCIEGPQDNADVMIKVNGNNVMPYIDWSHGANTNIDIITPIGDLNKAGCVDMGDFGFFANHYGETTSSAGWDDIYDLIRDYTVDMADFGVFANHYGEGCS